MQQNQNVAKVNLRASVASLANNFGAENEDDDAEGPPRMLIDDSIVDDEIGDIDVQSSKTEDREQKKRRGAPPEVIIDTNAEDIGIRRHGTLAEADVNVDVSDFLAPSVSLSQCDSDTEMERRKSSKKERPRVVASSGNNSANKNNFSSGDEVKSSNQMNTSFGSQMARRK